VKKHALKLMHAIILVPDGRRVQNNCMQLLHVKPGL